MAERDPATHRRLEGRVVIATHNAGKLREMRELLAPYGIVAVSAGELGLAEPAETGPSFAANATIKAASAARLAGLPALADDFGPLRRCARRRAGHFLRPLGRRAARFRGGHGADRG